MKKYAEIDRSNHPLIKVMFTGEQARDDNFIEYMQDVKAVYEQQKTVALIFDASNAVFPELKYQKMQAQWLKDNTDLMTRFCAGTAYIIPNLLIRNVLKAIFAFQKQPVPYVVCKTLEEAKNWCNQTLKM